MLLTELKRQKILTFFLLLLRSNCTDLNSNGSASDVTDEDYQLGGAGNLARHLQKARGPRPVLGPARPDGL